MDPTPNNAGMAEVKAVAASIVAFLKRQLDHDALSADARESVEVAAQCVETAFELRPEDDACAKDLMELFTAAVPASATTVTQGPPAAVAEVSEEARSEAERAKNEGNELMRADKPSEALERYSRAIELDPLNAVYFSNRAAAHYKLGAHEAAVADCTAALALQPNYVKALGRMGLALRELGRHREARAAFAAAVRLEPDNESYRDNLRQAEQRGTAPPELAGLLQSPALLSMATDMLADPNMQNLIAGLMGGTAGTGAAAPGAGGVGALLEAGQALAQHMQAANPELVDALRRRLQQPPAP